MSWLKRNYIPMLLAIGLVALIDLALLLAFHQTVQSPTTSPDTRNTAPAILKSPKIELKLHASGINQPTAIVSTNEIGDSRLFVVEQRGVIKILQAGGKVASRPFLDISNRVRNSGEMGLLGLAFHPDYKNNGYFYINYVNHQQHTVIARYQVTQQPDAANPATGKTLIDVAQPYTNHNGGDLAFGPDGYLYVALGDGGSRGDPQNRAQNLASLLGKVLRLDVNKGNTFSVPPDNPFIGRGGARPEIWAYGLRNPWRISFDKQTKDLFIADVGQGGYEEVNVEPSGKGGKNYGWRCYEGNNNFNLSGCGPKKQYIFPSLEYDHSENRCSVTGGYVHRGQKYPALNGKYFYGDFCGGQLYFAQKTGEQWRSTLVAKTTYQISAFGQDNQGELYLADYSAGNIYQVQDTAND